MTTRGYASLVMVDMRHTDVIVKQGFYDSYSAPSGFGNRNVLSSHDEIKGLPGSQQQPHGAPGLPPANSQSSQQIPPSSQGATQSQAGPGQGPP